MLVNPKSKTLISDVDAMISVSDFKYSEAYEQVKIGRYVINLWNCGIVYECLLLDEYDAVIDGFVLCPVPHLPWKNKSFATWLGDDISIDIEQAQDDYDREYWSF